LSERHRRVDPGPTPPRVLLVDDEALFRETLAKVLRARGLEVRTAGSGAGAFDAIEAEPADAVVLDLKMPGLDGLATLRRLQEIAPGVPVIILTGHGTVDAGLTALDDLAFDFLLKPVSPDRLLEVILAAIAAGRTPEGGRSKGDR